MMKLMTDRRRALAMGSGALILGASGVLSATRPDRSEAYEGWSNWDAPELAGSPLALIAAAVLAANPHNTQPWKFKVAADRIEVFADRSRGLGAMDACLREMHLGLGCALENLSLAGAANGFDVQAEAARGSLLNPDGVMRPVAVARLVQRSADVDDPLYRAIPERHTNRHAYDPTRAPPAAFLAQAQKMVGDQGLGAAWISSGPRRRAFDRLVSEATQAIIADTTMISDSDRWFRANATEIESHRDGPSLRTAGLSGLKRRLAETFSVSPDVSHQAWLDQTRNVQLSSAPMVGILAVRNRYDRAETVAAGRAWQRLHLLATANGLAMQPLNQPIEMVDRARQAGRTSEWETKLAALVDPGWQATFAFRIGYCGHRAPPSARRALEDVVTT